MNPSSYWKFKLEACALTIQTVAAFHSSFLNSKS
jgi:hypothetical protein